MIDLNKFEKIQKSLKTKAPLIHCITNPISINDCANYVLAMGAKPIMAEHPKEVEEITACSSALSLNIGNITDARLASIELSSGKAKSLGIPQIVDVVGISCSTLRLNYIKDLFREIVPDIIKGNMSEIKALADYDSHSKGIDVTAVDATTEENLKHNCNIAISLAKKYNTTVMASGKIDIIADSNKAVAIYNGCEQMSLITGTGCILSVITATLMSVTTPFEAGVFAATAFGIAGELADKSKGTGTYKISLLDKFSTIDNSIIKLNSKMHLI